MHKAELRSPEPAPAEVNPLIMLLNAGRNAELESGVQLLLKRYPDYGIAWHLLGASLLEQGKNAVPALQRAAELLPADAAVYNNLGNALNAAGKLDEAAASYRQALKINPDFALAHSNLGHTLNLLGQFDSAVVSCRRAVSLQPNYAEAHNHLGGALQALGQLNEAVDSYRRALAINPNLVEAHCNLGNVLNLLWQFDSALACFRRALELNPNLVEAHCNLGNVLNALWQFGSALACFRRALELNPDYAQAHFGLGTALLAHGQFAEAESSFCRALKINPDYIDACDSLLFAMNFVADHSPASYLEQARQYGRMVAKGVGTRFSAWQCAEQFERLRVGLVSGDFRKHSVGHFLEGLLSDIDQTRIELIAYSTSAKEDELTARIRPRFSGWKSLVGKSDEAAARLIHADGVHILIDISGHTAHNRLPVFAWKPAPVQVTWLGLPNTTGVSEIDYVLGDDQAIPVEHETHFSETVWRLPDSYLCFSAPDCALDVAPLPALAAGYVTFGSFNNLAKMNDDVVELWARILQSVPDSRLYLKSGQLKYEENCEQTRQRFAEWNIAPERLLLAGAMGSTVEHLSEYNKIDVALDTFPYVGVTTSVEALWMGVPVLTLHGDRFLALTAKSIAHHVGLPDWVAADKDNYVEKAVAFTANLESLATLRAGLRQQVLASPVFDSPRFARNFENALREMWMKQEQHSHADAVSVQAG